MLAIARWRVATHMRHRKKCDGRLSIGWGVWRVPGRAKAAPASRQPASVRNRRAREGSQQRKCDVALRCGGGQLRQRGALWALRWSALLYWYKQPLLSLLPRALEALHIAEHVAQHLVSPEPRRVERIPGLVAAPHPYNLVAAAPGDVLVAAPPRYPPE
eukprot:scaffold9168_cov126-Isochrysis_galbana.AAC.4